MPRSTKNIVSDITNLLKEAVEHYKSIEVGDFVHYQHPAKGEWHVEKIDDDHAIISDPDGEEISVPLSTLSIAHKKLTDADFKDMPMENSLDHFDDEIEAMPLDQVKDMPAMDKGLLNDPDLDAIAGDTDVEIDPFIYDKSIERNPDHAGSYMNDEPQDAGYPFPSFAGGLREFFNLQDKPVLSEGAKYHIENNIPLSENVYRYGSKAYGELWGEMRTLYESKQVTLNNSLDKWLMENTELGLMAEYEGRLVPLDMPMVELVNEAEYKGRKVKLNKPKRGGSKKFYVYVRNKKGNVQKVSFGAKSGGQSLAVKIKDKDARKAFADRHNCDTKKDKTKAGYWSCNLPRYAKTLGLGDNMNTYW